MKLTTRWTISAVILLLPYALVMVAGWWWLFEHDWLLIWAAIAAGILIAGKLSVRYLQPKRPQQPSAFNVQPSAKWSPYGEQAWQKVTALADELRSANRSLDAPQAWWEMLERVLDTVARQYHPESPQPLLETSVPHLLKIVELVARDLREVTTSNVPAVHMFTIQDMIRLRKKVMTGSRWYGRGFDIYRLIRLGLNPFSALLREYAAKVEGNFVDRSGQELKGWVVDFFVKKSGYYAIELYSGHLVLDEQSFQQYQTPESSRDARRAVESRELIEAEPLRLLVLGQVKAGKSSLINALFGEAKAAVDVVPRTRAIEPYQFEQDGLRRAIILDTAGYDDPTEHGNTFAEARDEVLRCDLVLVVCSALSAARHPDRRLLDELRALFQEQPDRLPPPQIVVLTHIDRLRPLAEWNPPYDVADPTSPKARAIAECMQAVADDLSLTPDQIVPVCLRDGQIYNVEEGLMPAIAEALPAAQRVKYLRALAKFQKADYWPRLWQQAIQGGRLLAHAFRQRRKE